MSVDPIRNFAKVGVSTTYNNSATSIVLNTGDGAKLPNPSTEGAFNLTWFNSTNYPDPSDDPLVEIVRVTTISGDTLTVVRGQEGTTGSNKNTSSVTYKMILSPTKRTIDDLQKFTIATDQTDFSQQSFQNILKNGNFESWSFGITYAPDGWYKQADTTILADSSSSNKKMGTYGAAITSPNAAQGYIYQSISDLAYFKGRIVTLGGWVKTSTAARVNLYITDGITYVISPYHTGSGSWEFLTVPFAVSGSATELTVFGIIYVAGTQITAYFDGMILVEGSVVPSFSPRPLYDDGKTIVIDSLNNRIGINTTIPYQALDLVGNIAITGTVDGVDISTHAADVTTKHLPSQPGNSGKYLTTDGSSASWGIVTDTNAIIWAIIFGG